MPPGKMLIILGLILILIGLFLTYGGRIPLLGKLPGDIRIQREDFFFYFPLASCLLVSTLISLIFWLFRR
jgi:hypothetical protein